MANVLVIDDDRSVLRLVEKTLSDAGLAVTTSGGADEGWKAFQQQQPDVVLLDIMLPGASGLQMAERIKEADAKLPIIFITAKDDSETAIEAMKLGAYEYLLKPLSVDQVRTLVEKAMGARRLMQAPVPLHQTGELPVDGDALIGRSEPMLDVYKQIGRVAGQDVTVLIRGESGTGKELVARAIYQHGRRKERPFLAVNCAALADTLLESELFGHEKGSFTGADRRRIGKFEQCDGGTIFLDEIGDMSPSVQGKVLRLLQEQTFERVGGTETIKTDVRIISATNRDLEKMIDQGQFRLDLFHRLDNFEIELPPLRKRGDDLELLVQYFLTRLAKELDSGATSISPEALDCLADYHWPGNVRELQSVLRKSMLMATGPVIVPEFLPAETRNVNQPAAPAESSEDSDSADLAGFIDQRLQAGSTELYAESLEMMERHLLGRVLGQTGGNQSQAAELLGITRGSLRHKIRALGIKIDRTVSTD